jgi:hypothetical protein
MKLAPGLAPLFFAAAFASSQTPLIGISSVTATVDNDSAGQAEAFEQTAFFSGTVTTLSVYLDASNSAKTVAVGLYSNENGHPKTLLGSGTMASPSAGQWNTVAISPEIQVKSGSAYHIALLGTGGTIEYRDTANGTHSETSRQTNLTRLPAAWSTGQSWPSGPVSAYGSGKLAGGVQIRVAPASATVDEGGALQFEAIVAGAKNTSVNWSVISGTGTITRAGEFKAPNREESDKIRAQSQADPARTAMASVTVPPVGISLSPVSAVVPPGAAQQFTADVTGTVNKSVKWSETGNGAVNQRGLYTAPHDKENDTVKATADAHPSPSAEAGVTVEPVSANACGNSLNWTNSLCQQIAKGALNTAMVNGVNDPNAWTVISRHGEYAQSETECNIPGAVSVANGALTIKAWAANAKCGDFDPTTGAQCSGLGSPCPGQFPYTTGDVQWNTFSFRYGVVIYRAQFPTYPTVTWPAIWMLGTNCQNSNKYTGDTSLDGCPNIGETGYNEVDNTELYGGPGGWGRFNIANPNWSIAGPYATAPIDGNYHLFATVWTPAGMEQYMDGQLEASTSQTVDTNMFLIVQIQTGGAGGTPDNSLLPAYLNLDYVKVCNSKYSLTQCEKAATTDPNVIFYDDFGGPAK